MYLALAMVMSRVDLELFETDESEVKVHRDYLVLGSKPGSKGIRARVIGKRE
jgi:hypothetical protein